MNLTAAQHWSVFKRRMTERRYDATDLLIWYCIGCAMFGPRYLWIFALVAWGAGVAIGWRR